MLNPQSGYLRIDANLLNLVSHDFWRQIAALLSAYKSLIETCSQQSSHLKTIPKHHPLCEYRKTYPVEYISLQTVFISCLPMLLQDHFWMTASILKTVAGFILCNYIRVHSQHGNQGHEWIIREFENGLFFTEKSGN